MRRDRPGTSPPISARRLSCWRKPCRTSRRRCASRPPTACGSPRSPPGTARPAWETWPATILLKTSRLTAVGVDPTTRTATVQAGALWSDVVAPAGEHGLVGLHGFSGGVGVAGYTLGGGIGWLSRRHGFASSHVRAFEVVGADGAASRIDEASDPDLFWALRGGGGRPVIVTSFELELFELREAFGGALMWPIEQAGEIVEAYREWIAGVPVELTSTIKLLRFPSLPTVADALRGRALVSIMLVFTGTEQRGRELVAPLRAVAKPYLDTLAMVPGSELGLLAGDPTDPCRRSATRCCSSTSVPRRPRPSSRSRGRAPTRRSPRSRSATSAARSRAPDADPGAAGPLAAEGLVYAAGAAPSRQAQESVLAAMRDVGDGFAPFSGPSDTILTFDELRPMRDAFAPDVVDRIEAIARAHDPDGRLVANHVAD